MKVRIVNGWPIVSTRFLLPTVALQGFRGGPRSLSFAFWTFRIVIEWKYQPRKGVNQ